ncbi:FAD-binding oxidoreductase [Amaricoccus solimangrovi]|uniref:FAD-binding oxidoreductase n=1 Tax=Amaricoccus solimangrovi TaxID=2589815 RepID=A0A501WR95_9RHOB|nr:FAD-binding oxidoreductase [Amaricoccus solimangrovi]TPE48286.1 FAD-binding oxidoreductase [Amaricoccus solimangrovi]
MSIETLNSRLGGGVVAASDAGYAAACDALVWNGRKPAREARLIARAASAGDVAEAVRYAAQNGLTVSPRGGGHQFTGIAARADMVIDLGALDGLSLDLAARKARIEPAVTNIRLAAALERHGLAFPVGHCASVPVSGYLLGGGIGWNAGAWGIACFSVEAVEVVMADGRLITATAEEHADVFWAARGAGPEFFGVVTAFHVRLREAARALTTMVRVYPAAALPEIARWAERVIAAAPPEVEFTCKLAPGPGGAVIAAIVNVYATRDAEAGEILAALGEGAPEGTLEVIGPMPTPLPMLYDFTSPSVPEGARYGVDTFWSEADLGAVLAPIAESMAAASSERNFAVVSLRSNALPVPGTAAFSREGRIFAAVYGIWDAAAEDVRHLGWLRAGMDVCRPLATGAYVGEADLDRPGERLPNHSPEVVARLARLRARHDPDGVFVSGVGRRGAAAA